MRWLRGWAHRLLLDETFPTVCAAPITTVTLAIRRVGNKHGELRGVRSPRPDRFCKRSVLTQIVVAICPMMPSIFGLPAHLLGICFVGVFNRRWCAPRATSPRRTSSGSMSACSTDTSDARRWAQRSRVRVHLDSPCSTFDAPVFGSRALRAPSSWASS